MPTEAPGLAAQAAMPPTGPDDIGSRLTYAYSQFVKNVEDGVEKALDM